MTTSTKKKPRKLIAVRISEDAYKRLLKRVSGADRSAPTSLGAVARALLEEHA